MKKLLFITILVLSFLIFSSLYAEKVTIEFWHAMGGGHGEALKEIVNSFNSLNPDIEVKPIYVGNYSALLQKLLASAQSGTLPVLSQSYSNWTSKLLAGGYVEDLTPYINDPLIGFTKEEWEDIFKPFREMVTWDGKIYALPFNKSTYLMFVNTDALDLEGLEIPKTMDELIETARVLTQDFDGDGTIDQYGLGIRPIVDTFQIFLRANGGRIYNEETGEVTINSPEAKEALQLMVDLVHKYKVAYMQGGYLSGPFGDGKVAIYFGSTAGMPYVDRACKGKHGWTWAPIPKWKTYAPPFAGTDVIMFSTAKPEEKQAAWKFMKFLISKDITTFWAIKTGYMPVRKSALETKAWKSFVKNSPLLAIPVEQIPYGSIDPKPAQWNEIRNAVSNAVSNAMHQKMTVDEAIEWAEKEIKRILEEK